MKMWPTGTWFIHLIENININIWNAYVCKKTGNLSVTDELESTCHMDLGAEAILDQVQSDD